MRALLTALVTFVFAGTAAASCYTPLEQRAEMAIRVHSELMIIGLSCSEAYNDPALFAAYATFTNRHQAEISAYEEAMIGYFEKTGSANPTRQFDHWRTSIANGISTRAALASMTLFCDAHKDTFKQAAQLEGFWHDNVETIMAYVPEANVASRPFCSRGEAIAQNEE